MSKFIITYKVDRNGKSYKTCFAGFIDRNNAEATAKFGGPFIDYATKKENAVKFDLMVEAREALAKIAKQNPDAYSTHKIEPLK